MRLAYVCADPGVPVFGRKGSSVHVRSVLAALARRGVEIELFAARLDGHPGPETPLRVVHRLPRPPKGDQAARESASRAANADLTAALEDRPPFDAVYERQSLWSWAGMEHAERHGVPGLLEVNAPLVDEQIAHRGLSDESAARRTTARALRAASAVLAVSEELAGRLSAEHDLRGRLHVVPNGVDPDRFEAPARPPGHPFTVGFVGTLKPWHGLPTLVDAFATLRERHPDARLLVVGDGPERDGLERDVARRGLGGAVELVGAVDTAAIPSLLARMDVGTVPYGGGPGCYFSPLKLFEYMAAGLAVAASDTGQVSTVIEHGRTGLLCPPGDPEALAGALCTLAGDGPLRDRLGRAAREQAVRRHGWNTVADRILAAAGEPAKVAV